MLSGTHLEKCLGIVAQEVGVSRDELHPDTEFADLGIDLILAQAITDRLAQETPFWVPCLVFHAFPDVQSFVQYLKESVEEQDQQQKDLRPKLGTMSEEEKEQEPQKTSVRQGKVAASRPPLVLLLHGHPASAKKAVFLLPDGSGSAMAYAQLLHLGADICVYGLNSPFLSKGKFSSTIEMIATVFLAAIREVQPHGPYMLGGWSAGGFYATEVARLMLRAGEIVECIVVIDSPCRLEYGSLPLEVVRYLAERDLMGNWTDKKAPKWLLDHFDGTLAAVTEYAPIPLETDCAPTICIIEATDGIFREYADFAMSPLNHSDAVTKLLLAPRPRWFSPRGWERQCPSSRIFWTTSPGNHFTMVHPPHAEKLGSLLRLALTGERGVPRLGEWSEWNRGDC